MLKEANDRVALEVALHKALEVIQEDFEEDSAAKTARLNELKSGLDREVRETWWPSVSFLFFCNTQAYMH